ncbi:MAG: HEAT repeat domain-containing protein, partial [Candidatus Aminicenantales bacterium]
MRKRDNLFVGAILGLILAAGLAQAALVAAEVPAGQEKDSIAYKQAYSLVLEEKWSPAKAAMDDLVRQFPKSAWVDDARFWSCYSQEKLGQSAEVVFKCYQKFIDDYPESDWTDDAKSNMIRLAQGLAKTGKPEYETIIKTFQAEDEDDVKMTALYALQDMGDTDALKTIIGLYDKASSAKLKSQIVFMLEEMESPEALAKLRDIAMREPDEEVRRSALFAIGSRGGPEAIKTLKEILASDAPAELRR